VEIGLGFPRLALLHLISHAVVRTLQMLRAPNTIQDMAQLSEAFTALRSETELAHTSALGRYMYHLSLERFHLDTFWERMVAHPLVGLSRWLDRGEEALMARIVGGAEPSAAEVLPSEPAARDLAHGARRPGGKRPSSASSRCSSCPRSMRSSCLGCAARSARASWRCLGPWHRG